MKTANTISFKVSKTEMDLINQIVNRVMTMGIKGYTRMDCVMDITACHANGSPLDLVRLLAADEFNFAHDVLGIRNHIDRQTGELKNCFVPRFSRAA